VWFLDTVAFLGCRSSPDAERLTYRKCPIQAAALDRASGADSFCRRLAQPLGRAPRVLGQEEHFRVDATAGGSGLPLPVVGDGGGQGLREDHGGHPFGSGVSPRSKANMNVRPAGEDKIGVFGTLPAVV
jgi:hypothetical protein